MSILIIDDGVDFHARAVAIALALGGHSAYRMSLNRLAKQDISIVLTPETGPRICLPDASTEFIPRTIWWARNCLPTLDENASGTDLQLASQEWPLFIIGLEQMLREAWNVNSEEATRRTNAKAYQLNIARLCGFQVPPTLYTNDRCRVLQFIETAEHDGVESVVKLVGQQLVRIGSGATAITSTKTVTSTSVPSDLIMRRVPVLLQRKIPKAYELRIVLFGHAAFTARIDAQSEEDWRLSAAAKQVPIRPWSSPPEIVERCRHMLAMLGLVTGSFDFIVTPAGEHVFLEINPMGRFLWIEEAVPELPLLDAFCQFLVSENPNFQYERKSASVSLASVSMLPAFLEATAIDSRA